MIDNILADHLLLSDSRLEHWLLRYSENSGEGSGGAGVGAVVRQAEVAVEIEIAVEVAMKVAMKVAVCKRKLVCVCKTRTSSGRQMP